MTLLCVIIHFFFLLSFTTLPVCSAPLNPRILNYDHPQQLQIKTTTNLRNEARSLPYGESIEVSFTAHEQRFELDLELNTELLESAVIHQTLTDGEIMIEQVPMIAFKGRTGDTRLTILDLDAQTFEGYTRQNGETFLFFPSEHEQIESTLRSTLLSKMLVVKLSDVVEDQENPRFCGTQNRDSSDLHQFSVREFATSQTSPIPTPCPSSPQRLILSVVTDDSYENVYSNARSAVISAVNQINGVYSSQTNIQIALGTLLLGTRQPFTIGCSNIETKLSDFSQWRGQGGKSDQNAGLYALFTTCYSSGTVGLAWIDVVCTRESYFMSDSNQWFSGTSVSSIHGSAGYLVAVHEIGHNFGADHDLSGGIMYPTTNNQAVFSRSSQTSVCNGYISNLETEGCFFPLQCTPSCSGKRCGPNGCGGSCGSCSSGFTCATNGTCVKACTPSCSTQCGPDGCGGVCGICSTGTCSNGICINPNSTTHQNYYLTLHNDARKPYTISSLSWSTDLENYAKAWAEQCIWEHSAGTFGENIGAWGGSLDDPGRLVSLWLEEAKDWDCLTNKCAPGKICGHWTQIVWQASSKLGCFAQFCPAGKGSPPSPDWGDWTMLVCNYDPAGNYVNQRPFSPSLCSSGTTCSTNQTCKTQNYDCGSFTNVCGQTIDCPSCSWNSRCNTTTHKCQCVPSKTCASEQVECGLLADGCDNLIQCPSCPTGKTCSYGKCICQPTKTCPLRGCGTIEDDGCGNKLSCGECSVGSSCINMSCSVTCISNSSCQASKFGCGEHNFGCGNVTCGWCGRGLECKQGNCVCIPTSSCQASGRACGDYNFGCGYENCGRCPEGKQCINGNCTTCSSCPPFSSCENGKCECIDGYKEEEYACVPTTDILVPNSPLGNWQIVESTGDDNWQNPNGTTLQFSGTSGADSTIYWKDVGNLTYSSERFFRVRARRLSGNTKIGFVFNTLRQSYIYVRWQQTTSATSGEWVFGTKSATLSSQGALVWTDWPVSFVDETGQKVRFYQTFPLDIWYELKLTIKNYSLSVSMPGNVVMVGVNTTQLTYMGLGLTSSGPSSFSQATLVSTSDIVITLTSCIDEESMLIAIANALSISPTQLETKSFSCVKRQSGPITATITLSGAPGGASSVSLASQLEYLIASGSPLIFGSGLPALSASIVTPSTPADLPIFTIPDPSVSTSGSSSGSSGINSTLIGLILGCVFAAIFLIGLAFGSAVIHKRRQERGDFEHQELHDMDENNRELDPLPSPFESPQPDNTLYDSELPLKSDQGHPDSSVHRQNHPSKPRGGVDVFGREGVTSITGRAPAMIKKVPLKE